MGDDFGNWFLINASPDLPVHLRTYPDLAPRSDSARNSPIAGVFLTSADVDHVLGLLSLREGHTLHIHATPAIEKSASLLGVTTVLKAFCGVVWHHPIGDGFESLQGNDGRESSLSVRTLSLSSHAPRYFGKSGDGDVFTTALQFLDKRTGGRVLIAPGLAVWSKSLQAAAEESTAVLLDGTFWSEDELRQVRPGAPLAAEMGHLPIENGTLPILRSLTSRYRVYLHINNTNPIFNPGSKESKTVESAGIMIGRDGMSFDL